MLGQEWETQNGLSKVVTWLPGLEWEGREMCGPGTAPRVFSEAQHDAEVKYTLAWEQRRMNGQEKTF